ncbi:MAG: ABC transporter ATP-binding protein [Nanoarchaeota archaeon]|nr:ABC transporter ATP-binding protein [Nanoarchaeota archaeon]
MDKEVVVSVKSLTKKYGSYTALDNVSFNIKRNTIFGLLGSNGAGKSTMLHILIGLLRYSDGDVHILGETIDEYPRSLKRKLSIVPQKISLYENLSIIDNLFFFGKAYGLSTKEIDIRIDTLKNILNLGDMNKKVKLLSGGYQRRVSLAVALIGDPEILILDEALVGIDLETKKIIINLLLRLKKTKTIIITTHSVSEAERLCDYVCFLHKGKKVLEGMTSDIIKEYSEKKGSEILLDMNDAKEAYEVARILKEKRIKVTIIDNKIKISSIYENLALVNILNMIEKNTDNMKSVMNIEIIKPSLEDIMLDLMSPDK